MSLRQGAEAEVKTVQVAGSQSVRGADLRVHKLNRIIDMIQTHDVPQFVLHDCQHVVRTAFLGQKLSHLRGVELRGCP